MPAQSPGDFLTIHNIDVDCTEEQTEYKRVITSGIDEDGNHVSDSNDIPYSFSHEKGFQTMYEGQIFAIRPGETRRLPRYIGEKYAKELIDHLLSKKERDSKQVNLVNDINERTKLLEQIIIDEEFLIQDDGFVEPKQDNFNTPDSKRDSKVLKEEEIEVQDSLRGFEVKKEETITLDDLKNAPDEKITDGETTHTRAELMAECKTLGIPIRRTDTARDLLNKIKAF